MKREQSEHAKLCATATSRENLARQVSDLAKRMGAKFERRDGFWAERSISVYLSFGPYRCAADFTAGDKCGAFLGSWYTATKSEATYPVTFAADINGTINTYHYSKATTCANSFETFLVSIERGLESLMCQLTTQIEDRTGLLADVIAETVAGEPVSLGVLPTERHIELARHLETRAGIVCAMNSRFFAKLDSKGNAGRDYLYMFMRHWAAAWIQKNLGRAAYRKLPAGYNVGRYEPQQTNGVHA